MLNKDIYAIYTTTDEFRGHVRELFDSFNDAMNNRFKYSNWYCDLGDVYIHLYEKNQTFIVPSIKWHVTSDGKISLERYLVKGENK